MAEEKKVQGAPTKAVTAVKKDDSKPGFFKRIGKWFREMKSELKKVVWPTWSQVVNNTLVVIVVSVIFAIVIGLIDYLAYKGVLALLNLVG